MLRMIVIDVVHQDNDFYNYDDNTDYHTHYSAFHDKPSPLREIEQDAQMGHLVHLIMKRSCA